MDRRERGSRGEAAAAAYLESRGCAVLDRQWRCRYGELDLVARDGAGVLLFVEVKLRGRERWFLPREAVDARKRERLRKTALLWMAAHEPDAFARFDVAEVCEEPGGALRVEYIEDAFS